MNLLRKTALIGLVVSLVASTAPMVHASSADIFSHYDVDNSGHLTKSEVDEIYQTVSDGFGKISSNPNFDVWADLDENGFVNLNDYAVVEELKIISTKSMLDTNNNNVVSIEEVVAALKAIMGSFGRGSDAVGYNPNVDFDPTDFINLNDYGLVVNVANSDPTLKKAYMSYLKHGKIVKKNTNIDLQVKNGVRVTKNSRGYVNREMGFRTMVINKGKNLSGTFNTVVTVETIDGTKVHSEVIPVKSLRRNQREYINFTWTPDTAGRYIVKVSADDENVIVERNEKNNAAKKYIRTR